MTGLKRKMTMEKTYKVIKAFSNAEKGDMFTEVAELGLFECIKEEETENTYMSSSMVFDAATMEDLSDKGYVQEYNEDEDTCECCDKLANIGKYIDDLVLTYTKNYDNVVEQYNQGEVQPCVKVEAETVYHNLLKVLNSIKNKINE